MIHAFGWNLFRIARGTPPKFSVARKVLEAVRDSPEVQRRGAGMRNGQDKGFRTVLAFTGSVTRLARLTVGKGLIISM